MLYTTFNENSSIYAHKLKSLHQVEKKKKTPPYITQTTKLTKGEIQKLYQHTYLKFIFVVTNLIIKTMTSSDDLTGKY